MTSHPPNWVIWLALIGIAAFAIYYPYRLIEGFFLWNFAGPDSWSDHRWIEPGVQIPFLTRLALFLLWLPTIILSQAMLFAALRLVWLIRQGEFFKGAIVIWLQWVGLLAAAAGIFSLIAFACEGPLMTRHNEEFFREFRLRADTGEIGQTVAGLGLFLLAWVLNVAVFKNRDNKEMI